MGEFWNNRWWGTSDIEPKVLVLYRIFYRHCVLCLKAKRGAFTAPIGTAGQIHSANTEILQIFLYSLDFANRPSRNYSIGAA
jgi:hypothetical protein